MKKPPFQRMMEKVDASGKCWVWHGQVNHKGYGVMGIGATGRVFVHRFSWEIHRGPIPDGMCVCHHCDNPPCINPDHLFIGTKADNNADATRKGRAFVPPPNRGEKNFFAKITADVARKIRARRKCGATQGEIAREFGVSQQSVSAICLRRMWSHI